MTWTVKYTRYGWVLRIRHASGSVIHCYPQASYAKALMQLEYAR